MTNDDAFDPEAFRAFEYEGWERLCGGYNRYWTEMTSQAADALLDATGVGRGSRLLDVATGPGNIARAALARGAEVTGVDFSPAVLELARRESPGIDFRHADAEDLPFADESFDAVVINFGMLHFPHPERALEQAHRVLAPGGRLAFTVWAVPGESAIGVAMRAVKRHGSLEVDLPQGTDMFRFADAAECGRVLSAIGFAAVASREIALVWRFRSADEFISGFTEAAPRSGGILQAQSPEHLPAVHEAMRRAAAEYERDGVIEMPMPAVLTAAVKG